MVDKRFWSGAIIVATVVVAGASALPALLLALGAPVPMVPPVTAARVENKAAPAVARVEVPPLVKAEAPAPGLVVPMPAPAAPAPKVAATAVVETPMAVVQPPVREAAPVVFPPVQPVGVAAAAPPTVAPPAAAAERPVIEKPVRAQRTAAQRATKGKRRPVRPTVFPLREFLAWRR